MGTFILDNLYWWLTCVPIILYFVSVLCKAMVAKPKEKIENWYCGLELGVAAVVSVFTEVLYTAVNKHIPGINHEQSGIILSFIVVGTMFMLLIHLKIHQAFEKIEKKKSLNGVLTMIGANLMGILVNAGILIFTNYKN